MPGRPRSTTTRSGWRSAARRSASSPVGARSTSKSRALRLVARALQDLGLVVDEQDPGHAGATAPSVAASRLTTIVDPPAWGVVDVQLAAHGLDEALGHRQPQPHAVAAVAHPLERLEQPLPVPHRDAGAPVDDPEVDAVRHRAGLDAHRAIGARRVERVGGQVGHCPLEEGRVGRHPGQRLVEVDDHGRGGAAEAGQRRRHDLLVADRPRLEPQRARSGGGSCRGGSTPGRRGGRSPRRWS